MFNAKRFTIQNQKKKKFVINNQCYYFKNDESINLRIFDEKRRNKEDRTI